MTHDCTGAECRFCGVFAFPLLPPSPLHPPLMSPLFMPQLPPQPPLELFRDSMGHSVSQMPTRVVPSATTIIVPSGPWPRSLPWWVVIHQRADNNHWAFPGGHQDIGESILNCARREAMEETGLAVDIHSLICVDSDPTEYAINVYPNGDVIQYCNLTFLAFTDEHMLALSSESRAIRWARTDTLHQPFLPAHAQRLAHAMAGRGTVAVI